jgi:beta-N-acetylhexosaminidase
MKQKSNWIGYLLFYYIFFLMTGCQLNKPRENVIVTHNKPEFYQLKDTSWKSLSLRQKIGQTMLMLPDRKKEMELGNGSLKTFFEKYPVSGFYMGWKLYENVKIEDHFDHIQKACKEYQEASPLPLIFQEDHENGVEMEGMALFPNEMSLGASNSPELAYAYGRAVALQSLSVGVKWVLNPVADINLNPFNPIANVRSISDDPAKAIKLLSQQIKGLQHNGVAATIKHFPGDGVDFRDQHILTSCNSLSLSAWKEYHGRVFKALIDSGVACIMAGHISLPAYQKEKKNGMYLPATLSRELLTGLLKGELGFQGVIVSDAMVMGGFRSWNDNDLEGEIKSFEAGVDVLLWPSYEFMDTLEARIIRGVIPIERLNDAVKRVWTLKERFGMLDKKNNLIREMTSIEKDEAIKTSKTICEKAVTLVRDRNNALPLSIKKDKHILVVAVTPSSCKDESEHLKQLKSFAQKLKSKGFDVDFKHNILFENQGWTDDSDQKYDRILVVLAHTPHFPFGPLQLYEDESQTAWAINSMSKDKIIVINFGNPYLINEYFESINTCINAYSNMPVMQTAVISALMGETKMTGQSPVNLTIKNYIEK